MQYVEDPRYEKLNVDPVTVLHQAVKGLAFLHSIGISMLLITNYGNSIIGYMS